ncbi:MAG: signal recognition particle protein [Bdellovibrionales bacterium]|nr:signal recognition particle protein [Bdellovibrionales bacterium]
MFENLSDKLVGTLKKVRGQSRISEANIDEAVREIRMALLEADVNFKVVKTFLDRVKQKALGADVLNSVSPGQQFTKIVNDELTAILGGTKSDLILKGDPAIVMVVGLNGAGKTTTSAKLALHVRQKIKKKPGLVSVDVYRPAAREQLEILAKQNGLPIFTTTSSDPKKIMEEALLWARDEMVEVLILDTAGRMQIDEELMDELRLLKKSFNPAEVLLVADSQLGQQSVNVAEGFHQAVQLTGLILTKIDGDARGGAALSIRETLGLPVKFLGTGEKIAALELFHPDRLASRLLDMGDVLSLVEKAQEVMDEKTARDSARKMAKSQFTVDDFLKQLRMMKKMGGMESMMSMLPGMGQLSKKLKGMTPPDQELKKIEAIIQSMTNQERNNHKVLNGSRRLRIAKGSGTQVSDVNKFINQFEQSQKMMSQMMKMGLGKGGGFKMPF